MRNILCSSLRGKAKPLMMLGVKRSLLGPKSQAQTQCANTPDLFQAHVPPPHLSPAQDL